MAREHDGVTQVADGVLRIHRAGVNCYLVSKPDGILLIDAGLPGMWSSVEDGLRSLGAVPADITSVVLTHGHFDHVGLSERLRTEHGVASRIHPSDGELVRHPYRYAHENARWWYPLRHPRGMPLLARMAAAGALRVPATTAETDVVPNFPLDAPGQPVPIWSPGHTAGHCAYFFPEDRILFTGDALVTLDPYTGRTGPRMVARAATADSGANLDSLENFARTDAVLLLPGHGAPWDRGAREAVHHAVHNGIA